MIYKICQWTRIYLVLQTVSCALFIQCALVGACHPVKAFISVDYNLQLSELFVEL